VTLTWPAFLASHWNERTPGSNLSIKGTPHPIGAGVPVGIGRDEARELARRELADPAYDDEPSLVERIITWVLDRIDDLLSGAASLSPGRWLALIALIALLVGTVLALGRAVRSRARRSTDAAAVFPTAPRSAAEHVAAADAAAARADWSTAVVERFRGIVRQLEERGVIDVRAGRTAEEVAAEAGSVLPACADDLVRGAVVFDRIRYGGMTASPDDDALLRRLAQQCMRARPEPALAVPE
jgi:Domain of unknown function (DUF4129)